MKLFLNQTDIIISVIHANKLPIKMQIYMYILHIKLDKKG